MGEHQLDAEMITVATHDTGLRVVLPEGEWRISFPAGWHRIASDEEDLWAWTLGESVGRIRLRRFPRVQLDVDVTNAGASVAQLQPPVVELTPAAPQTAWFGGATGELLHAMPDATVVWVQIRGFCAPLDGGFRLLSEPLLLPAGQGASAAWRREVVPPAVTVPEPSWVPRVRHLPLGEALEIEHSDAALAAPGLELATSMEGSVVEGRAGLHEIVWMDARGTTTVEVGWFAPLEELAQSTEALADPDPNLVAWLLAAGAVGSPDLDALDVALAEAMEQPSAWGVLAGMRAVTGTDLPVAAEVRDAARAVWLTEADTSLRRLLLANALVSGWEPAVVEEWLCSREAVDDPVASMGPQEMLASIGFGRVTSSAHVHGGRSVALAEMWFGAREESFRGVEWGHAIRTARSRSMCALSLAPAARDLAWLLAVAPIS